MQLLVRNKVKSFATWYRFLLQDTEAAAAFGITLDRVWQAEDDSNDVYFILNVEDRERAIAFMERPESAEIGEQSGVIDGEVRFLTLVE